MRYVSNTLTLILFIWLKMKIINKTKIVAFFPKTTNCKSKITINIFLLFPNIEFLHFDQNRSNLKKFMHKQAIVNFLRL